MAGDDQWHGVGGHGSAHFARRLRFSAEILCDRPISRRLAPSQRPDMGVDPGEEGLARSYIERYVQKSIFSPLK